MPDPEATVAQPQHPNVPSTTDAPPTAPHHIGRYRIEKILGRGGFGLVYLAHDEQLRRPVAIKVPHGHLVARADAAESYLLEARTVAGLDHPNIVPVYDVGGTDEFPCFVVSKYIDGTDLAARLKQSRVPPGETVELVAAMAEALHHAHKQGLVHRDVKPGNILLDRTGRPFLGDFGLALRERDVGQGPRFAGTPAYMSPEQARGEGHRVDARSDVFSLGVVLYELLTGRRPFAADSQQELLEQVVSFDPRPARQIDDSVPRELDRVCSKTLAKRASERYSTAKDLADDLRYVLAQPTFGPPAGPRTANFDPVPDAPARHSGGGSHAPSAPTSQGQPLRILPKGLRSFDAHDADFFLELLPGPRDRDGLPDTVRFWKTRIEETDPDDTFPVGLLYGPSGCGKSSLVKAGLLPRVSADVLAVYVEATPEETEARLLAGVRKRCPDLTATLGLKDSLAALRRGQGLPAGKKVVLVIDQFEQWLHGGQKGESAELVQALRQCDGGRVQCVVMVRDDFWMAATRFMRELEVRLVEGHNSAAVDLFPIRHAEKVLAAFGGAFGGLDDSASPSAEQKRFIEGAVAGLAQDGKVVSVRLALFAEMMKGRPWTPATLKAVGGTEGVGVTFLEETFGSATAPPEHRYHQRAARGVLAALLPDAGAEIKGHMRSRAELLDASGYANRPKDFDDLMRILDAELRLVTPTDPEGQAEAPANPTRPDQRYYQLAHDYLVPALREWLTRKQKETRRGRAELFLADRAAVWNARPENRQLPSLPQWLAVLWYTRKRVWTPPQRAMMARAGRYHAARAAVAAVVLALIGLGVWEGGGRLGAKIYRDRLWEARTEDVPELVKDIAPYRRWIDPRLRDDYAQAKKAGDPRMQLHLSLALLPVDPGEKEYLYERLLTSDPREAEVLRDALAPHTDEMVPKLWAVAERPAKGSESHRLRAAAALAAYDPDGPRWARVGEPVSSDLVRVPAVTLAAWMELIRPVRGRLIAPLSAIYRDATRRETERSLATDVLAAFASDQPQVLAGLVMDADEKQFAVLFPKLKAHGESGLTPLREEVDRALPSPAEGNADARERFARRQANAAVALLRLDQPAKVWPLLRHSSEPLTRSFLVHRLSALGADPVAVARRFDEEPDPTIRRALVLSLGEFGEEAPPEQRAAFVPKLQEVYRTNADPGLHAATEWVLRRWKQDEWLTGTTDAWAKDAAGREKRLERIRAAAKASDPRPQWYVNGQGQTMVALPGPIEFAMGAPAHELGRLQHDVPHRRRIGRTFAIADKPVTVEQFLRFRKDHTFHPGYSPTPDCPVQQVTWYLAAEYCNWLSAQEGIPPDQWCYEPNAQGKFAEGMKIRPNYLRLSGYRLPTEAESEYACRAGATTTRFYGDSTELLVKYAWFVQNARDRTWPVGSLKPNDFGLFDTHGNVWGWCQDRFKDYPIGPDGKVIEDEAGHECNNQDARILRGGSFFNQTARVRAALRYWNVPTLRDLNVGFRPARTLVTE